MLHVLMGAARGGCEGNALCVIRETTTVRHDVLVFGERGPMSAEFEDASATVRHVHRGGRTRNVEVAVEQAIREFRPAGVVAWHGMVMLPEILHALADFHGRVLVHGGNPAHSMPCWVNWRFRLRERRLGRRCEATYVCCSQYVADSFEHSSYLRRFTRLVVPNGVRPLTVRPHEPRAIEPGKAFTVGMLARLDEIKDHPSLLRAFALLQKDWPSARLELAGDGTRRGELEQLARDLGIADQVRVLGLVDDVYDAMKEWDIFAYATTDREGMGNALAEAMMLGLPCVAVDIGPIREVAGDPPAARLVPKGDAAALAGAITELARNAQERSALSCSARARAMAEFSGRVFAERQLALLEPLHQTEVIAPEVRGQH